MLKSESLTKRSYQSSKVQHQLILRVPEELASDLRSVLQEENKEDEKDEQGCSTTMEMGRSVEIIFQEAGQSMELVHKGKKYPSLLWNLPTPVETHKTFDGKIFLKSGDIGQVLEVCINFSI